MFRQNKLERVKGIEPSYAAWEAAVLPLNYTRDDLDFTWVVINIQFDSLPRFPTVVRKCDLYGENTV